MAKRGGEGDSDLIKAVKAGDIVECRRLLESKEEGDDGDDDYAVDIHGRDSTYGWSPIMWASTRGHNAIVELLLSKGANIHDRDRDDATPIMWASEKCHVDVVQVLISNGVNIHDRDSIGLSPILIASMKGHVHAVDLLLSNGANIHDTDNYGYNCYSIALEYNRIKVLYRLRKWPTTMAIIMLQELALIYIIDSESVIDLHQYLGRPDDCSKSDNEEDYKKDEEGNVL